ncbi:DUF1659 domain-containing protein [Neobacillus ginsengisoli]|jgi:hypothetical protein|uniref:DUF1659 domain-containing protein n=1 Tax=Neobacillus ginsengisoli TaxID=904295 RepID=A0ABT9Y2C6_9BACI|nr:DUF1659 domain-containing protein [Neobacillus ginsengisoli]MDQ0201896.1 hypothetical protein [Neobacillus ginsengisoli]
MAQAMLAETKLRLVFEVGMDEKGAPILKAKTLNNIKKEATANQLYQVAQALSVLCKDQLSSVERADNTEILA